VTPATGYLEEGNIGGCPMWPRRDLQLATGSGFTDATPLFIVEYEQMFICIFVDMLRFDLRKSTHRSRNPGKYNSLTH
jgi:hypothetical protein